MGHADLSTTAHYAGAHINRRAFKQLRERRLAQRLAGGVA
jgi:hypothetical protein